MFEKLKNPSAAIIKRLSKIGVYKVDNATLENEIKKMPIVDRCFGKIETVTIDNVLFHGSDSIESYIKILSEYGFDQKEKHLGKCIRILVETGIDHPFYEQGISKIGRILEDKGYSGSKTIRDSVLASSGFKDQRKLKERIDLSLACFIAVNKYEDIHDFSYSKNGKWIFKENCLFPDYYNLRLLAFTDIWKSEENFALVNRAINQLIRLQPLPPIYVKEKGRLIAPGSYLMHEFDVDYFRCNDDKKAEWLLRNEYLARMGVLSSLKKVMKNLDEKEKIVEESRKIKKSYSFMKWGAYSGLSLEKNWRKEERKLNDIIFRFGLIKYYYSMKEIA